MLDDCAYASLLFLYIPGDVFRCVHKSLSKQVCMGSLVYALHGGWVINSRPLVGGWMHWFDDSLLVPLQASRQNHKGSLWKEENQKLPRMRDGQHQQVFVKPFLLVQIASKTRYFWRPGEQTCLDSSKDFGKTWQHIANKRWILGFFLWRWLLPAKNFAYVILEWVVLCWPQLVLAVHREDEHTHVNTKHKRPTF